MKRFLALLIILLELETIRADVRVFIRDTNGLASLEYECTAGEVIRAFALDVSADRGQILGVSNFFRGESKAGANGYGIFPASLRDHITILNGTNVNWGATNYSPLAVVADDPGGTLPGLNSSGVTLEFAALWDPNEPTAMPRASGRLCTLTLSQAAWLSVAPNAGRGGVISAFTGSIVNTVFVGATVGPAITTTRLTNGVMEILYQGGELQTAPDINGPWVGTGDQTGIHAEPLGANRRFYRVRGTF